MSGGHGEKIGRKQELAVAALLAEPTVEQAAIKAGVSGSTLRRWLSQPKFRAAFQQSRRELLDSAIGRLQAASGQAVDTLLSIAKNSARDGDRVRAAVALLDYSLRGAGMGDVLHRSADGGNSAAAVKGTAGVVEVLARRLGQLDTADLPLAEKARLSSSLADALLRALGADVFDKRLAAIQTVLEGRRGTTK